MFSENKNERKKIFSLLPQALAFLSILIMLFLFFNTNFIFAQITSTPVYLTETVEILHLDILVWGVIWFLAIYLFLYFIKILWKQ